MPPDLHLERFGLFLSRMYKAPVPPSQGRAEQKARTRWERLPVVSHLMSCSLMTGPWLDLSPLPGMTSTTR